MPNFFERLLKSEPVEVAKAQVVPTFEVLAPTNDPQGEYITDPNEQRRMELEALCLAFKKNPWLRRCVKAISTAISKNYEIVPRNQAVYDPNTGALASGEEVDPAKVARIESFLNNLNPQDTFESYIRRTAENLLVFGHSTSEFRTAQGKPEVRKATKDTLLKAYIQAGFPNIYGENLDQEVEDVLGTLPEDGTPAFLRILPTPTIEVVTDDKGNITQFVQWAQSGKRIVFQPQEIFHVLHPDSHLPTYGDSQIACLATLAMLDTLIDQRQKNILQGEDAIDTLFTIENATPDNVKRLNQELVDKYRGSNAKLRFIVAPDSVKANPLGKAKDGDFLKLKEWLRDEICLTLGVPLSVLGETSGNSMNGAGADSQLRNFIENTCRPLAVHIEAAFNRFIMSRFQAEGIDYVLKLILEDTEDNMPIEEMYDKMIRNGSMTVNEVRAQRNQQGVEGGNIPFVAVGAAAVPLDQLGAIPNQSLPIAQPPVAPGHPKAQPEEPPAATSEQQKKAVEKAQAALRDLRKTF